MPSRGMGPRGGHRGGRGGAMARGGPAHRGNMHRGGGQGRSNNRGHFQQVSLYLLHRITLLFNSLGSVIKKYIFLKSIRLYFYDHKYSKTVVNTSNIVKSEFYFI